MGKQILSMVITGIIGGLMSAAQQYFSDKTARDAAEEAVIRHINNKSDTK